MEEEVRDFETEAAACRLTLQDLEEWIDHPGQKLRTWRRWHAKTLKWVWEYTGISISRLHDFESGKTQPSMESFRQLLTLRHFKGRTDDVSSPQTNRQRAADTPAGSV